MRARRVARNSRSSSDLAMYPSVGGVDPVSALIGFFGTTPATQAARVKQERKSG